MDGKPQGEGSFADLPPANAASHAIPEMRVSPTTSPQSDRPEKFSDRIEREFLASRGEEQSRLYQHQLRGGPPQSK